MIYGIGTDIADIQRIRKVYEKHREHFVRTVLTAKEIEILNDRTGKAEFIAGRWAAKEAFAKALGTGIGEYCSFTDIEILPNEQNAPEIVALYGNTAKTADGKGICKYHISISHEREYAVGFVVMETE